MTNEDLESCLTAVEAEAAPLKTHGEQNTTPDADTWLDVVFGAFKDDPLFDAAERYRREWRNLQQPEDAIYLIDTNIV